MLHLYVEQTSTKLRHWGCRGLVEVWSNFGLDLYQNSTTLRHRCRSLVEISTKVRHQPVYIILIQTKDTFLIQRYSQFWWTDIYNFEQQIFTILSNNYSQFWINDIHTFDQNISTILTKTYTQFWPNNIHNFGHTKSQFWSTNNQIWNLTNNHNSDQVKIMTNNHNSELFDLLGSIISASVCNYKMYVTII